MVLGVVFVDIYVLRDVFIVVFVVLIVSCKQGLALVHLDLHLLVLLQAGVADQDELLFLRNYKLFLLDTVLAKGRLTELAGVPFVQKLELVLAILTNILFLLEF